MTARVLIVDPDHESAVALGRVLFERGHATFVAHDAEEALDTTGFDPDVVVTELDLTGASGLELVAALNERGAMARAVVVTGAPSFSACREAFKLGALEFLAKPVDMGALVRAVEEGLASRDAHLGDSAFELRAHATPAEVRRATRETVAFAFRNGALPAARARLGGAVSEILDNVLHHAYRGEPGEFRVIARCEDDSLVVRIVDEGVGFDTVCARLDPPAPPLPLDDPEPGGLARTAALVESLCVESARRGTRVTLRVALTPASFANEASTDLSDVDYLDCAAAKRVLRALRRGRSIDLFNLPPAIAVALGRLLAGATPTQLAQSALWS